MMLSMRYIFAQLAAFMSKMLTNEKNDLCWSLQKCLGLLFENPRADGPLAIELSQHKFAVQITYETQFDQNLRCDEIFLVLLE